MAGVVNNSVADGIPFDPELPGQVIPDNGYRLGYNPTAQLWEARPSLVYHAASPITTSTAISLGGTLTLSVTSNSVHWLTGSGSGFSVVLPAANTLVPGWKFEIWNTTNNVIIIKDGAGNALFNLAQQSLATIQMQTDGTTVGTWKWWQILASSVASGIINYNIVSSTPFSTSSRTPTFVSIPVFSVIPQAGTYGAWYNASVYYTTTPKAHWWALYKAGVVIPDSLRTQDTAHSNQNMVDTTMTVVQVNGSETIDVRVTCDNTGTLTVNDRTLLLIRLGT